MNSVESYLVQNGPSAGSRLVLSRAGDLTVEILPDRGMDIGRVWWRGKQLSWILPQGIPGPGVVSASNDWLANFGGGLLTTCGPENFGSGSLNQSASYPLHGSFTNLKFEIQIQRSSEIESVVSGKATYSPLFGESWQIHRGITISSSGQISVQDDLLNIGISSQPVLMLYHVNLGGDFLSSRVRVTSPNGASKLTEAEGFSDTWEIFGDAHAFNTETVYLHQSHEPIWAVAYNPDSELSVRVSSDVLSNLFQWKFRRRDRFVLGLEPASSNTLQGRSKSQENAPWVDPGQSWKHELLVQITQPT